MAITKRTFTVQLPALSVAVALIAVALAACGTDTPTTPTQTVTATVTQSAAPSTTVAPETPAADPASPPTQVGGETAVADSTSSCAPDIGLNNAATRDGATTRRPLHFTEPWVPYATGGSWCPGLSWAQVEIRAHLLLPVRPRQMLIYHNGHFMGTGIYCSTWHDQDMVSTTADAITISYHWVDESIPEQHHKQDPLGRRVVTFRWNGSRVVMEGTPPPPQSPDEC